MRIHYFIVISLIEILGQSVYSQIPVNSAHKVLNVNSKVDDYGAYVTGNGLTMYFASNRFSGRTHIYAAKRKTLDAPWSEPEYCKITNNPIDYVGSITLDNIGRFYFGTNRETRINGDINIWEGFGLDSVTTIRTMPSPINTIRWESQPSVTRDGADLYFVSNRQSAAGAMEMIVDIFVSHRKSDGSWSEPESLGPNINIGNNNNTPFISPDGRFLFFASREKRGIDIKRKIYMSEHIGPKNTDWSKAVMLPAPINSDKDDTYPMIASDGKTIFFTSNRDAGNGLDIYEAILPQDIQDKIAASFLRK